MAQVEAVLNAFTAWLDRYGETSRDHQTFFAGGVGRTAKALYYRNKWLGLPAVAPMIFCEAFLPRARRFFHKPIRFPISDAHYAMGFAFLYQASGNREHLNRAVHFLEELKKSRNPQFKEYAWGYPFDWVTRNGTIAEKTPLITSTPYMWEAFLQVHQAVRGLGAGGRGQGAGGRTPDPGHRTPDTGDRTPDPCPLTPDTGSESQDKDYRTILESIARHAAHDFKDFRFSDTADTCSYTPHDKGGVINAAAYRSFLLTSASKVLDNDAYAKTAERNLNFVLENQNDDGSWYYAVDGVRDFVDHFHTCFVMKALAKIHTLTGNERVLEALQRGVAYYLENLFAEDGLPKPFSRAPRLTVYKRELYDCAESINLCLVLKDRFPPMGEKLEVVVKGILSDWIQPAGCFRSRRLLAGWDNVPMHRWGQSQMFRALAFYLRDQRPEGRGQRSEVRGQRSEGSDQATGACA